ncbi:hypothetical protein HDV05_007862 [Chytridiales sp. JEL 0842]|nr:hypothetical protein HDV05_007862 [Chytridiales sp. JEL 0842]
MNDVVKFLEGRHAGLYKVYNLCSERTYKGKRFLGRISTTEKERYGHEDLAPASATDSFSINQTQERAESETTKTAATTTTRVAAIHCKAGKGRTGTMIAAYLIYAGICPNAEESLKYYAGIRTKDGKGVTIPSQQRYVHYFDTLLKSHKIYTPRPVKLEKIRFVMSTSSSKSGQGRRRLSTFCPIVKVKPRNGACIKGPFNYVKDTSSTTLELKSPTTISGDVKLEVFLTKHQHKSDSFSHPPSSTPKRRVKLFHCWFNTFFLETKENGGEGFLLRVGMGELDMAAGGRKLKRKLGEGFAVELEFRKM